MMRTQCDYCDIPVNFKNLGLEETQVFSLKENGDFVPQIHVALHTSMEQTPSWKPDSFSVTKVVPRTLQILMVHYRVRKSPPIFLVVSQIYLLHAIQTSFFNNNFNIVLPSTPSFSTWTLHLSGFLTKTVCTSAFDHTCHMPARLFLMHFSPRKYFPPNIGFKFSSQTQISYRYKNLIIIHFLKNKNSRCFIPKQCTSHQFINITSQHFHFLQPTFRTQEGRSGTDW